MVYPGVTVSAKERGPEYSYAGAIVRADRAAVLAELVATGFSGWVGPAEDGWVVLVCRRLRKAATAKGHDLAALGAHLAATTGGTVLAADVHRDRVLRLAMWHGTDEVGRYLSNPAFGADEDDDEVWPEPQGVENATAFADTVGHHDATEELEEILGELLDEEEQTESERLWAVLRLLRLPSWLVASVALPKDVPGGPLTEDVTLLFRGRTGPAAKVAAWATGRHRRRKH